MPAETLPWDYTAGVSGTVTIPAGARVAAMSAHSSNVGATVQIGTGTPIPLPSGVAWEDTEARFTAPATGGIPIVFVGTDTYYVAWYVES